MPRASCDPTSGHLPVTSEAGLDMTVEVDDSKAVALSDIMTDLPSDEPLIVFARFTENISKVHEVACRAGRRSFELSGNANTLTSEGISGESAPPW